MSECERVYVCEKEEGRKRERERCERWSAQLGTFPVWYTAVPSQATFALDVSPCLLPFLNVAWKDCGPSIVPQSVRRLGTRKQKRSVTLS